MRRVIRKLHPRLSTGLKHAWAGPDFGVGFDESQLEVFGHRLGQRLTVPFFHLGLRIKQVDMAGSTFHVKKDDILGFGREVGRLGRQRIHLRQAFNRRGRATFTFQQVPQGNCAEPSDTFLEKVAASLDPFEILQVHGCS